MFRFANIELIYLLLLIPVLMLLFWVAMRARDKRMERFASLEAIGRLLPRYSAMSVRVKFGLFLVAVALLIISAARPQVGSRLREVKSQGVELMLVVDVSNSMLAEDLAPNRLESTKLAVERLFAELKSQERVGLIAFAGDATVELPITSDTRMAATFAQRLSPKIAATQGTNIGKALDLAMLSFSHERDASKVIILVSDGEAHDNGAVQAAQRAKREGVKIFTVGIGTPEGAPITIGGEMVRDEKGDLVVSQLNEEMLQEIAQVTDAGYIRATQQSMGFAKITSTIEDMEHKELATVRFEEYGEQYQYLLALALLLLVMEFMIQDSKNPRLRRFNIFEKR